MRSILAIAAKEYRAYWTSPIAYAVLSIFMIITGTMFFGELFGFVQASQSSAGLVDVNQMLIRPFFYNISIILVFMMPVITMRLLAEERRQGTLEVVLTTPVREIDVVLGKFLAGLGLFAVLMAGTALQISLLFLFGQPDVVPVVMGFLGLFLCGAVYVSLGLFLSSLTQNQIVAAVMAFALFLFLWLMSWLSSLAAPPWDSILGYASLSVHFDNFGRGVLDTRDAVFFVSVIGAGLFLAVQSVQATRWKP